jgi:hypothetical protein
LKSAGITHVLQVMGGLEPIFADNFKYKVIDVKDVASQDMIQHFSSTVRWMTEVINRGGNIFCHW